MAKQYTRKIVRHGPGTCTISLPADWLNSQGLKSSDTLNLFVENENLVISGNGKKAVQTANIRLSQSQERFVRIIVAKLYKNGFDEIVISYTNPKTKEIIRREVSQNLLNFTVAEESDTECVLRMLSPDNPSEIQNLVKRAIFTTSEIIKLLNIQTKDWIENIRELEHINNQVTNYAQRLLTKFPFTYPQSHSLYVALWQLEKIADDCRTIAVELDKTTPAKKKAYSASLVELQKIIERYKDAFFSTQISLVESFYLEIKNQIEVMSKNQKNPLDYKIVEVLKKIELITSILIMQDSSKIKV